MTPYITNDYILINLVLIFIYTPCVYTHRERDTHVPKVSLSFDWPDNFLGVILFSDVGERERERVCKGVGRAVSLLDIFCSHRTCKFVYTIEIPTDIKLRDRLDVCVCYYVSSRIFFLDLVKIWGKKNIFKKIRENSINSLLCLGYIYKKKVETLFL